MKRSFVLPLLTLIFAVSVPAQSAKPSEPQSDDVVKISTNLIQLDVTVTDKSGKVIKDIRPEEIEIYENGEKQNLSGFTFVAGSRYETVPGKSAAAQNQGGIEIPRPAPVLRAGQVRRTIALVVDDLTLSYESAAVVKKSLRKFIDEQMQEGDMASLVLTGATSGLLQQFTADKRILIAAIENIKPRGRGRMGAFEQAADTPQSLRDPKYGGDDSTEEAQFKKSFADFQESIFGAGTLGTLKFMVNAMRELPGRKSVVLFSDGFSVFQKDEHGYTEGGRVVEKLRVLVELANRASVVFYTVDARQMQNPTIQANDSVSLPMVITNSQKRLRDLEVQRTTELFDTQGGLDFLSKETGGFPIKNQNNINMGLERVLLDQSYYLVSYEPDTDTFDAKTKRFNKIEIKVKRDGAQVRYRSSFFAATDADLIQTTAKAPAALDNAITSPFAANGIGLRLSAVFGNNASGSYVTPLLNIDARDLKFTDNADGTKRVVMDVMAMSFNSLGEPIDKDGKTLTVDIKPDAVENILKTGFYCHFNFPVKNPGAYQFRVAVKDKQADAVGTAGQYIEVPDLKKNKMILSGILLENFTPDQWSRFSGEIRKTAATKKGEPDQTNPMNDTSHRRFGKDSVLRYGFEIYNGATGPNAELFTKLRVFRDGKPVLDGPEVPVDLNSQTDMKRIKAGGAMNLPKDMPPGDYILQVIVMDGTGKSARQVVSSHVEFQLVG